MPELPEVETIRRDLDKELSGREILSLWWDTPKMLLPDPQRFQRGVVGSSVVKVTRRAKLLIFELAAGGFFSVHLKMSGRLLFRDQAAPKDEFVHIKFRLSGGKELRFAEARKFGHARLLSAEDLAGVLEGYGPEPLADLTLEKFKDILRQKKLAIKKLLLDQQSLSGVGNIYANDALWLAGINPERSASGLSDKEVEQLFEAINSVLKEGLATGGASDQWYRNAYGGIGHYQEHFKVYGRVGEPCHRCGSVIRRFVVGGRGTFYCPTCQPKDKALGLDLG